jgi:hypothetical protein
MGPREVPPPLPELEANMAGPEFRVTASLQPYNWMQGVENNLDTSHNPILHVGSLTLDVVLDPANKYAEDTKWHIGDKTPDFLIQDFDAGVTGVARRPAGPDHYYYRAMNFLMPFYQMIAPPKLGMSALLAATVPVDDYHSMQWRQGFNENADGTRTEGRREMSDNLPNTTDWLGRFRSAHYEQAKQDGFSWGIDRELQRLKPPGNDGYSGIRGGAGPQDRVMTWSQGALAGGIVDRSREHLGTTDAQIIRARRRLIDAAIALHDQGTPPPGVDTPWSYRRRSGWSVLPREVDYWEATEELRKKSTVGQGIEATPTP